MYRSISLALLISIAVLVAAPAAATPFNFNTGLPNGQMGAGSRPASPGLIEIQAADDFILTSPTTINHATFYGLIPSTAVLSSISRVLVKIFRVFPNDSVNPPSGRVPTRVNSPADNAFAVRDSAVNNLSFTVSLITNGFTVANTVLNGINPLPNQTTGGEGPATGQLVFFDVTFTTPFFLPADHYYFVPQVQLPVGSQFFWLSAPRPTIPPFTPDLQGWIRNTNLAPDWLRIGTDIVGGATPPTFNFSFSLTGFVPHPIPALELLILD
jgi:hypothetical protein